MKKATSILLLLLLYLPAYSQVNGQTEQKSETVEVYFDHDKHAVDLDWAQNRQNLVVDAKHR